MKYWTWMGIAGVAAIALLGAGNAWADDAAQCWKLYLAKQYKQVFSVSRRAAKMGMHMPRTTWA